MWFKGHKEAKKKIRKESRKGKSFKMWKENEHEIEEKKGDRKKLRVWIKMAVTWENEWEERHFQDRDPKVKKKYKVRWKSTKNKRVSKKKGSNKENGERKR